MQTKHVLLLLLDIKIVHLANHKVAFIVKKPQEQDIGSRLLNYRQNYLLKQHCLAFLPFCWIFDQAAAQGVFAVLLNRTWHSCYECCQISRDWNLKG